MWHSSKVLSTVQNKQRSSRSKTSRSPTKTRHSSKTSSTKRSPRKRAPPRRPSSTFSKSPHSNQRRPHHLAKNKASFVAVRASNIVHETCYLVVLNHKNQWMLPGGLIEPGEHPRDAARRELYEESGFVVNSPFYHIRNSNGVHLFFAEHWFDANRNNRLKTFHSRLSTNETYDYGFVRMVNGRFAVCNLNGTRLKKSQRFRGGTTSHLSLLTF